MHDTRLDAHDQCILRSLIGRKGRDCPIDFTLEGEGPRVQRNYHEWEIYVGSHMAHYGS